MSIIKAFIVYLFPSLGLVTISLELHMINTFYINKYRVGIEQRMMEGVMYTMDVPQRGLLLSLPVVGAMLEDSKFLV